MSARILGGRAAAAHVLAELRGRVAALKQRGVTPTLGVLLIGDRPESVAYVRNKQRAAEELGIAVRVEHQPANVSRDEIARVLAGWNADQEVHGIVLQFPLPNPGDADALRRVIVPVKDVDALHPENIGLLALGKPRFVPPTPAGILDLLMREGVPVAGRHVCIVGRGMLVGCPLALLLLRNVPAANATVTVCHRGTSDLTAVTRSADILVVAAGVRGLITGAHVRPGAVVVDVGMHRTPEGWVGDVDAASVREVASAWSPVPGGVGPMTVAHLLSNVVLAAERSTRA